MLVTSCLCGTASDLELRQKVLSVLESILERVGHLSEALWIRGFDFELIKVFRQAFLARLATDVVGASTSV